MLEEIPNIAFKSNHIAHYGLEIITIENLLTRKDIIDHDIEKAHQLEFNLLVYYTKGKSKHLIDFVWHEVQENTLIHVSKGQINAFKFTENLSGFIILFTEDFLTAQLNKLSNNEIIRLFNSHLFSPRIQIPSTSNVITYIHLLYKEYTQETKEVNTLKVCDALYGIIFSKLEQLKQYQTFHIQHTDKLETFLAFKNLVASDFTHSRNADYYASKLNITYKHLNVICKEIVDTTAKNFIDAFIILEAKRKLINSTVKSNELAFQLGFNEPTNFVKYFKKFTGLTPNSFKKLHK
ncbi:helix-turn-helix domain-containing protein [Aquimarina sp. 2201CG14-23]|uniref:helix-turn-helix domain-containing protein n=1 Tax=Aquimarina mycalae TaxID=3040073 RepID=UPI0024781C9E|nr:helix-turn-helix domain-containing protein [Aquimarina sp. 2201CG14-23]MDH7445517.1 helix-turn-helix domain-containing protein [Aquimarina sp. 2201CG14-23]